ncbi:MAG: PHP domain-containing protein [Candidatus Shapirobacteria bacterium]
MKRNLSLPLLVAIFTFVFLQAPLKVSAQSRPAFSGLNFYYGDLHAHSGYSSDGVGRPETAYDNAINNRNDFFALTEHDEAFVTNPDLCLKAVDSSKIGTPQFQCAQRETVGTTQ